MTKEIIKINEKQIKQIISESILSILKNKIKKPQFDFESDSRNCIYVSPDSGYKVAIFSNGNVYCGPYCEPAEPGSVEKTDLFTLLFEKDEFYKVSNEELAEKIAEWCMRHLKNGVSSKDRACETDTWLL